MLTSVSSGCIFEGWSYNVELPDSAVPSAQCTSQTQLRLYEVGSLRFQSEKLCLILNHLLWRMLLQLYLNAFHMIAFLPVGSIQKFTMFSQTHWKGKIAAATGAPLTDPPTHT